MIVIQWLRKELETIPNYSAFYGNNYQWIDSIMNEAKEMELEQRKQDFRKGWKGNKHKDWNCEFYLIKHINNDFKSK